MGNSNEGALSTNLWRDRLRILIHSELVLGLAGIDDGAKRGVFHIHQLEWGHTLPLFGRNLHVELLLVQLPLFRGCSLLLGHVWPLGPVGRVCGVSTLCLAEAESAPGDDAAKSCRALASSMRRARAAAVDDEYRPALGGDGDGDAAYDGVSSPLPPPLHASPLRGLRGSQSEPPPLAYTPRLTVGGVSICCRRCRDAGDMARLSSPPPSRDGEGGIDAEKKTSRSFLAVSVWSSCTTALSTISPWTCLVSTRRPPASAAVRGRRMPPASPAAPATAWRMASLEGSAGRCGLCAPGRAWQQREHSPGSGPAAHAGPGCDAHARRPAAHLARLCAACRLAAREQAGGGRARHASSSGRPRKRHASARAARRRRPRRRDARARDRCHDEQLGRVVFAREAGSPDFRKWVVLRSVTKLGHTTRPMAPWRWEGKSGQERGRSADPAAKRAPAQRGR